MYKLFFSSLMLLSATAYADNTPTFNVGTGALVMPFVSTTQGNFKVTLQYNPALPPSTFTISEVGNATAPNDSTPLATFSFQSGLLNLPKVTASDGAAYTASLQLSQNVFKLVSVAPFNQSTTPSTGAPGVSKIAGCSIFPSNNYWNVPVANLPLHPFSAQWINLLSNARVKADFGNGFGQPINTVAGSTVPNKATFNFEIPNESDVGPYPIPANPLIEDTSDKRLFIVETESCTLFEAYKAQNNGGQWSARRGAIWSLASNQLRPINSGSADDGGFPTVPGLVRYEEAASGTINHALRFTHPNTNTGIWPARHVTDMAHFNPVVNAGSLPMGARLRLKASIDISSVTDIKLRAILQAMKTYGIILTDNGQSLFLSGDPDPRWDDDLLAKLKLLPGSAFEVVNSECMKVNDDSGEANPTLCR